MVYSNSRSRPFKSRRFPKRKPKTHRPAPVSQALTIPRNLSSKSLMPDKFFTKLNYVETTFTIDPTTGGVPAAHVFSANGMYDPSQTTTGHQPRGFDTFMTLYDHYTVIGSKIDVYFCQEPGTAYYNNTVGISLRDSASVSSDVNDYLENRHVVSGILASASSAETSQPPSHLSLTYSTKKFLGISHPMSEVNVRGSAAANPGEEAFFHVFASPLQSIDGSALRCQARIEYLCVFTEPKVLTQS